MKESSYSKNLVDCLLLMMKKIFLKLSDKSMKEFLKICRLLVEDQATLLPPVQEISNPTSLRRAHTQKIKQCKIISFPIQTTTIIFHPQEMLFRVRMNQLMAEDRNQMKKENYHS